MPENRGPQPYITPARLGVAAALCFFALFLSFFGWRLSEFVRAPDIVVNEPQEETVYDNPTARLKGTIQQESRLTVNGREITIDKSGVFDENFELATGVNTLEFVVEDRFGKITKIIRHVILR